MIRLIFATRDRPDAVARTLASFRNLRHPDGGLEIVCADNSSDESLARNYTEHATGLPLRFIREPKPGKNVALNRVLAELGDAAESELLVFTDDDVLVPIDWLVNLQRAARANPDADLFGGPIRIAWLTAPPAWLEAFTCYFGVLFASTEPAPGPCAPDAIWGPNVAIRGARFAGGVQFDPAFGPNGSASYAMGSETELLMRLAAQGATARMVGDAYVEHTVDGAAVTLASVLKRAERHGAGVLGRGLIAQTPRKVLGLPPRVWRSVAGHAARAMKVWSRAGRLRARYEAHWLQGALREVLHR